MFKNKLVLVGTVVGIIVAIILIIGVSAGVWWLYDKNLPVSVLTVQGTASKKIKYDKVTVNLTVSLVGTDVAALNTEVDNKTSKIIDYLKSQNIAENEIQTNKSSYPDYTYPVFTSETDTAVKNNQIRVESNFIVTFVNFGADSTKPNKVISEATKLGVNRFGSFNYDFNDNKKVCADLENEAITNAWTTAQNRVKSLGGGRIVKKTTNLINNCGNSNYPIAYSTSASAPMIAQDNTNPPAVLGGEQELTSSVDLTVEYK